MNHIKFEGTVDVLIIEKELSTLPDTAWEENLIWTSGPVNKSNIGEYSQQMGKSVIREQRRIFLMWHENKDGKPFYTYPNYRSFPTELTQWGKLMPGTIQVLNNYFALSGRKIVRLYFSILDAGKQIYPHPDQAFELHYKQENRYGLCVNTNDGCTVSCVNDKVHVPPGTIYWIDNYKTHSAANFGKTTRAHMYMDVIDI